MIKHVFVIGGTWESYGRFLLKNRDDGFGVIVILCRRDILEKKLVDAEVSEEEQNNLLKYLEKKETEYMRLQRHKMGADDFEPLTMIGKGAFGEVIISSSYCTSYYRCFSCLYFWSCFIYLPKLRKIDEL